MELGTFSCNYPQLLMVIMKDVKKKRTHFLKSKTFDPNYVHLEIGTCRFGLCIYSLYFFYEHH